MTSTNGSPEQDETGTRSGYVPPRIDTSAPAVEQERMPLFYIGDQEYTGPVRVSASTALRALEISATKGNAAGAFHCLIEAIGEEGYQALVDCPQLTYEDAREVLTEISARYYGQALALAGK